MSCIEKKIPRTNSSWWEEEYGFFGDFYYEGDHSKFGYLAEKALNVAERTELEVNGVIRLCNVSEGQAVLDTPCGYGRHSLGLAAAGVFVHGVDINDSFLQRARLEADLRGLRNVQFSLEDMREIQYDSTFDAAINMCYSFGFFESAEDNLDVLRKFYRALKPGGRFLMHTDVNLERVRAGKYKHDETRDLESGRMLTVEDRFDPVTKRMNGAWIISDSDGAIVRKEYSVRVYDRDEFITMCLGVGFSHCVAYSSWSGEPWSADAEELMFVATK